MASIGLDIEADHFEALASPKNASGGKVDRLDVPTPGDATGTILGRLAGIESAKDLQTRQSLVQLSRSSVGHGGIAEKAYKNEPSEIG